MIIVVTFALVEVGLKGQPIHWKVDSYWMHLIRKFTTVTTTDILVTPTGDLNCSFTSVSPLEALSVLLSGRLELLSLLPL